VVSNLGPDFVFDLHGLGLVSQVLPLEPNEVDDSLASSKVAFKSKHNVLTIVELGQIHWVIQIA